GVHQDPMPWGVAVILLIILQIRFCCQRNGGSWIRKSFLWAV
ncbi:lysis protein, partial [Shigella flexneri]|nr:lysis protein [Shigella flexneri]EGD7617888.1 lysis protein [Shigella flexneri]